MEGLRCQVCVQEASRTEDGYLFLATAPARTRASWEGFLTAQPPLCLEHAEEATEKCGHLVRTTAIALRARVPRLHGVIGTHYRYGPCGIEPVDLGGEPEAGSPLPYRNRRLTPWFLASQLVRELRGVTVINLADEVAAAVHSFSI